MARDANHQRISGQDSAGFTLIELLVSIAVIAALLAILLPVLSSARYTAKQSVHLSNLRQLLVAVSAYATSSSERFPAYLAITDEDTDAFGSPLPNTTIHPHTYLVRNTLKWTDVLYDSDYDLPEEDSFGSPDELNPIRRTHYLLTGAAFAEPSVFVDNPDTATSLMRIQKVTRTRFPSAQGYLLATHSDVWLEDREDLDPLFAGLGDGSAARKPPIAEALPDLNGNAIGMMWPVIWTRNGLHGKDFD